MVVGSAVWPVLTFDPGDPSMNGAAGHPDSEPRGLSFPQFPSERLNFYWNLVR
jgi:hypothetical protein